MIGIIGAMELEIEAIKNMLHNVKLEKIADICYYLGILDGVEVVVAKSYEGKVNSAICAHTMILKYNPEVILNVGVAGSISNELSIGDIALSEVTVEFDFDTTSLGYDLGYIFGLNTVYMKCDENICNLIYDSIKKYENTKIGCIASSDKFISDEKDKQILKEKFENVIAVDMESASICHVCNVNNVRFCAIRVISDTASNIEFREFAKLAATKIESIIKEVIKKI